MQLRGGGRCLVIPGKDGQLAGIFQNGLLDVCYGGKSLSPQFFQKLVQGIAVFSHGGLLKLSAANQNGGCTADQRPKTNIV